MAVMMIKIIGNNKKLMKSNKRNNDNDKITIKVTLIWMISINNNDS